MKSKREQILKLCDPELQPIYRRTEYDDGKEYMSETLKPIILALIDTLEKYEAHFNEIKNYDPSGDGDSPYEVSCKALTASPIYAILKGEK